MKVSAIIVTRGDIPLAPVIASLPEEWEKIVWNNGGPTAWSGTHTICKDDLSVYGRYAAIEYATGDLIYVQDDDCVVSDPQAIVDAWLAEGKRIRDALADLVRPWGQDRVHVVCNMPARFRDQPQYAEGDSALVGFGACFHRDAPQRAWWRFRGGFDETAPWVDFNMDWFHRTCDIVFTALTPRVLVDVPYENLPWAEAENRMWKQPDHVSERMRMLELVREVRDG